jgi:hypothetical protein
MIKKTNFINMYIFIIGSALLAFLLFFIFPNIGYILGYRAILPISIFALNLFFSISIFISCILTIKKNIAMKITFLVIAILNITYSCYIVYKTIELNALKDVW